MANPDKTVTVTIEGGNIKVVATHTDGYPMTEPTIAVTQGGALVVLRGGERTSEMDPGGFERRTVLLPTARMKPGTYDVTVVCTGETFQNTVTVS